MENKPEHTQNNLPKIENEAGLSVLRAFSRQWSPLDALQSMHQMLGEKFRVGLPGFDPSVLAGPEVNRYLLVTHRENFLWRNEKDPVTKLLGQGLLVVDGEFHRSLREKMEPSLHLKHVKEHIGKFQYQSERLMETWKPGEPVDMLVEMRKLALLILVDSLFGRDFMPVLDYLWEAILRVLTYISPGLWLFFPDAPRYGYQSAIDLVDRYLFQVIEEHRSNPSQENTFLGKLVADPDLDDQMIRDQMLTMLIAGHDTSTALLAWCFKLLEENADVLEKVNQELESHVGRERIAWEDIQNLKYLDWVIKETLRLYPPIHMGNRMTACDMDLNGSTIPANTRVMYSIYLTQRDPNYWQNPECFNPERFNRAENPPPTAFSYLPFGGGPRNCIGASFAQVEAKVVLATILRRYKFTLVDQIISARMGATLEPEPGVIVEMHEKSKVVK